MTARPSRIDLFCRVIDNYGDIGVCWRLARQLAMEEDSRFRLIVDRLEVAQPLVLTIRPELDHKVVDSVTLQRWRETGFAIPADLVIKPSPANCRRTTLKAWLHVPRRRCGSNLEYLSSGAPGNKAITACRRHPRLALIKHFLSRFMGIPAELLRGQNIVGPPAPAVRKTPMRIFVFAYDRCIDFLVPRDFIRQVLSLLSSFPGNAWDGKLKHWCDPQAYNALNTAPIYRVCRFRPAAGLTPCWPRKMS